MKTGHSVRRWLRRRRIDVELARELATHQPVRSTRPLPSNGEKRA